MQTSNPYPFARLFGLFQMRPFPQHEGDGSGSNSLSPSCQSLQSGRRMCSALARKNKPFLTNLHHRTKLALPEYSPSFQSPDNFEKALIIRRPKICITKQAFAQRDESYRN